MWYVAIMTVTGYIVLERLFGGIASAMEILGLGQVAFFGILLAICLQVVAMSFDRAHSRLTTWK